MTESEAPKQANLLDTSEVAAENGKGTVAADHGRVFVPAGGIKPKALRNALRAEHSQEKYPGHVVVFQVTKNRVVQVLIKPKK